jgi:hypothetical protein
MKYIKSQPNPQGGLGHQFHNWILGMLIAKKYKCEFINTKFTGRIRNGEGRTIIETERVGWNDFLNFGSKLKNKGEITPTKTITLPRLELGHNINLSQDELDATLSTWGDLIKNSKDNTLINLPVDQMVGILSETIYVECGDYLKDCYWSKNKKYDFNNNLMNVVVHIRRGDISKIRNGNRWLEIYDYKKQLDYIRKKYGKVKFHILSEGNPKDFDLIKNEDVNLCINNGDLESFNMMCSSDILITGLSSFSILASYLTKGLVFYNPLLNFTRWNNIETFYNINELCLD